jgi:hypothetical protein
MFLLNLGVFVFEISARMFADLDRPSRRGRLADRFSGEPVPGTVKRPAVESAKMSNSTEKSWNM